MESKRTLTIPPDEIERIILESLKNKNIKPSGKINFKIGSSYDSFGINDRPTKFFDGCSVDIESEI